MADLGAFIKPSAAMVSKQQPAIGVADRVAEGGSTPVSNDLEAAVATTAHLSSQTARTGVISDSSC